MDHIRKILIALDFTDADQNLMNYTKYLAEVTQAEELHFVHVIKSDYLVYEMESAYEGHIEKPLETQLQEDAEEQVKQVFGNNDAIQHCVKILKGQPSPEVLKYAQKTAIDLIVVGEKEAPESSGIVASRLSRRAHCSVLYVPENRQRPDIKNVLIPVDFSAYSDLCLDFAERLAQKTAIEQFYLLHVFKNIPSYNMIKTYQQMVESMQHNAEEAYHQYIHKLDPDIDPQKLRPIFKLDEQNNPARKIYEQAVENNCDLIIIGAKGQSQAASFFIGSVTEKLLKLDKSLPVLILKKKGENKGLLETLFSND